MAVRSDCSRTCTSRVPPNPAPSISKHPSAVANHRLQILATVALIGMYLEVVSTYVVNSIDQTILFDTIELLISDQLPLGDWLTGKDERVLGDSSCWVLVWAWVASWRSSHSNLRRFNSASGWVSSSDSSSCSLACLMLSWFAGMFRSNFVCRTIPNRRRCKRRCC